jgi:predicted secreted protein
MPSAYPSDNRAAHKMSKPDRGRAGGGAQIAAFKSKQTIDNTASFSASQFAISMYTMAHRLLRLL